MTPRGFPTAWMVNTNHVPDQLLEAAWRLSRGIKTQWERS